jgi:hypothetical protein
VDRTHAIGNAIVPQVAEWIFSRIKEAEDEAQSHGVARSYRTEQPMTLHSAGREGEAMRTEEKAFGKTGE